MSPYCSDIEEKLKQEIIDNFKRDIHKLNSQTTGFTNRLNMEKESFSFKTKETVTLEQINEKLDRLLMLNNVISSTLYTGKEVIEAFKKLNGGK